MTTITGGMPSTTEAVRVTYYRHGEVSLLLEPIDQATMHELSEPLPPERLPLIDDQSLTALKELFARIDHPLHPTAPLQGPDGQMRRLLPMGRSEKLQVLLTVNLASWIERPVEETNLVRLQRSIEDVAAAVRQINMGEGDVTGKATRSADTPELGASSTVAGQVAGNYRITAASPNWLGLSFNA
ncbi:MAG: hypothetical protein ACR2PL_12480 [Dehalococcoidia bacterium]